MFVSYRIKVENRVECAILDMGCFNIASSSSGLCIMYLLFLLLTAEQQIPAPATKKGRFKFKSVNDVAAGLNRKRKAPPTNSPPTSAAESGGGGDVEDSRESAAFTRVCMIISSVMSTAVLIQQPSTHVLVQQACMFTLELYSYLSKILILC